MNSEDAKKIPFSYVLEKLGVKYSHTRRDDDWYFSPFRNEKHASFKVNAVRNMFKDFGSQLKGGTIIDFMIDYLGKDRNDREAVSQALKYLEHFDNIPLMIIPHNEIISYSSRYKVTGLSNFIKVPSLVDEAKRRNLSPKLIQQYVKQGWIEDTDKGKKYAAFCFENIKGGWEVSIPNPWKENCFKLCVGPKAISIIPARDKGADFIVLNSASNVLPAGEFVLDRQKSAYMFEGFWDFLSYKSMNVREAERTSPTIISMFDNDQAGEDATHALALFLEEHDMPFGTQNHLYEGYKDLSAKLMSRPSYDHNNRPGNGPSPKPQW